MIDREKVIKGLEELEGFLFKEYANTKAEESKIYYDRFKSLSDAIAMLKEQEEQIKNRDESLEKAREEIKWLRGMLKEQEVRELTIDEWR